MGERDDWKPFGAKWCQFLNDAENTAISNLQFGGRDGRVAIECKALTRLLRIEAAAREVTDASQFIDDYDVPQVLIDKVAALRLALGSLREGG